MLMRSSSAPILNSYGFSRHQYHHETCYHASSSTELADHLLHMKRTKSSSVSMCSSSAHDNTRKLLHLAVPQQNKDTSTTTTKDINNKTTTFSGLGEKEVVVEEGEEYSESEGYYVRMIEMDPTNSLFLANYANFLIQVKGEMKKAEEYLERAILVGNANDGNALSLYAHLIWHSHKDLPRALSYFHQAVHSSPHDCYIQASYARFLWEVEEDEENFPEEEEIQRGVEVHQIPHFPPNLFLEAPPHPITAPS